MRQLDVFLGDNLIGHVIENRKGGRFEYERSVVDKLAGRPVLSMAFPAKDRPFGEAKTSAWFNGLLPEGNQRDEICRSLGVSPYDWTRRVPRRSSTVRFAISRRAFALRQWRTRVLQLAMRPTLREGCAG